tara:strand:+ start:2725 stop:3549 length:825 start_codon:yes stop_codon:yes gene_type:complete
MNMIFNIDDFINMFFESGEIAKKYQAMTDIPYNIKNDKTKVSDADIKINDYIRKFLKKKFPTIKVLSEEDEFKNQNQAIQSNNFFIIDPIDGTNSFIEKKDFYTINLTLIYDQAPCISIIYAPNLELMLYADINNTYKVTKDNGNINKTQIKNKIITNLDKRIKIITTKREKEIIEIKSFLSKYNFSYDFMHVSSSIKFCYVALSQADVYIRKENIKLWDVAAGFHISKNAGLNVLNTKGDNLYEYFLKKKYLKNISNNDFRIDEFIITNSILN